MLAQAAPPPAAEVLFDLADPRIDESSGLAASRTADAYYTVNDSNPELRYYTVDGRGRTVAVTRFAGVDCRDLEDMAPGPGGTLYLGDIGDNDAVRPRVLVHRVAEPRVDPARHGLTLAGTVQQTASLTYPDGAHDAETLLVSPRTGQVVVVTKGLGGSRAYVAPQPLASGVMRAAGRVQVRATGTPGGPGIGPLAQLLVTGGAVSPDGSRVVLRTYTDAYVYRVTGDDVAGALSGTPVVFPLPGTRQGEAVTWTADGAALLTSSEGRGAPVGLVHLPAAAAAPSAASPAAPSTGRSAGPTPAVAAPRPQAGRDRPGRAALWVGGVALVLLAGWGLAGRRRETGRSAGGRRHR